MNSVKSSKRLAHDREAAREPRPGNPGPEAIKALTCGFLERTTGIRTATPTLAKLPAHSLDERKTPRTPWSSWTSVAAVRSGLRAALDKDPNQERTKDPLPSPAGFPAVAPLVL